MCRELPESVLGPPVGVKYRLTLDGRAVAHSHIDGLADKVGAHMVDRCVSHDFLCGTVQNSGQVDDPCSGVDIVVVPIHVTRSVLAMKALRIQSARRGRRPSGYRHGRQHRRWRRHQLRRTILRLCR